MNQYWDSCGQCLLGNNCSCTSKKHLIKIHFKTTMFKKNTNLLFGCLQHKRTKEHIHYNFTWPSHRQWSDMPPASRGVKTTTANTGNLFVLQRSHRKRTTSKSSTVNAIDLKEKCEYIWTASVESWNLRDFDTVTVFYELQADFRVHCLHRSNFGSNKESSRRTFKHLWTKKDVALICPPMDIKSPTL